MRDSKVVRLLVLLIPDILQQVRIELGLVMTYIIKQKP